MLSLFSSVGICRILRYRSSNTSTVEQQVCPRFFSGPSKFGEMRRCERKMLKCNAELVDIVFRLMFETFWVAPYDLRRDFPVLVNFERHARHASVLLGKIDFASASGAQIYELGKTVAALDRAVRQIAEARLFARGVRRGAGTGRTHPECAACGLRRRACGGSFARFGIAAGCRLRPAPATAGRRDSVMHPRLRSG